MIFRSTEETTLIEFNDPFHQLFHLLTFLHRKTVITGLVCTSKEIGEITGIKVILYLTVGYGGRKQPADQLRHLIGIDIPLEQSISRMQLFTLDNHSRHMIGYECVGSIVGSQAFPSGSNHQIVFRMGIYFRPRLLQVIFQETVKTRGVSDYLLSDYLERGSYKLGDITRYRERISRTPRHILTGLTYRTKTPIPGSAAQYLMRVEHTPGDRFGNDCRISGEVFLFG